LYLLFVVVAGVPGTACTSAFTVGSWPPAGISYLAKGSPSIAGAAQ
jgi:hypothetical protein